MSASLLTGAHDFTFTTGHTIHDLSGVLVMWTDSIRIRHPAEG